MCVCVQSRVYAIPYRHVDNIIVFLVCVRTTLGMGEIASCTRKWRVSNMELYDEGRGSIALLGNPSRFAGGDSRPLYK